MRVEKVKFTDYNGVEREETFYFNINKAELAQLEMSVNGGFTEMLSRLSEKQDIPEIQKIFTRMLTLGFGEKSADGRRFIKSEEMTNEFTQTEAFVEIYMKLCTNVPYALDFISDMLPDIKPEDKARVNKEISEKYGITNA